MANEPTPPPPPGTALSAAKPISAAEFQREIGKGRPATPAPTPRTPPTLPEIKEDRPSPPRPDFKAGLRKRVMEAEANPAEDLPEKKPVAEPEPEKKIAAKREVVSADDAAPAPKPDVSQEGRPDEQRRVLPHDKPETARRIKAILSERDAAQQEAAAIRAELEAAKKTPAVAPEEVTKLREEAANAAKEAARYRRMVEVEKDPEIIAKYDEPTKQMDESIKGILKQYNLGEFTLKAVEAEGGFGAFSRSGRVFPVTVRDPDNENGTITVKKTAAELSREWLNAMAVADAEAVKAALGKQQLLQSEKAAAKQTMAAEASQFYENQTKAQREAQAAAQSAQEKAGKDYDEWVKKTESEADFLKDKAVPEGASEAERNAVAEYNEFNKQLRASLKRHPTNAAEYGQLKLEAAEAHHMRRVMGDKDAEIAALKEQLSRAKGAMRTTSKGGSLLKGDGKPEKQANTGDPTDYKAALRGRLLGRSADEE